jgi:hypothetical protein
MFIVRVSIQIVKESIKTVKLNRPLTPCYVVFIGLHTLHVYSGRRCILNELLLANAILYRVCHILFPSHLPYLLEITCVVLHFCCGLQWTRTTLTSMRKWKWVLRFWKKCTEWTPAGNIMPACQPTHTFTRADLQNYLTVLDRIWWGNLGDMNGSNAFHFKVCKLYTCQFLENNFAGKIETTVLVTLYMYYT